MNRTTAIVIKLIDPLLKQGQTIRMENYNSPKLERRLKQHIKRCVGTLKLKRKNALNKAKRHKTEKEGMATQPSGPVSVNK
jgi:hypothetical protein